MHPRSKMEGPPVQTKSGPVVGQEAKSSFGHDFHSFVGIPYATVPKRFSPSQPVEPWSRVRRCVEYGPPCRQRHVVTREYIGSEDCLSLNVYTRAMSPSARLPVMVWVHGGAFTYGSSDDDEYGPAYAMDEEIVLVTFNYRLGVFGFLATDDGVLPGNLGIKDMLSALRWVKENIAAFGGDRGNVTLAGVSSGAASVHFLMLTDLAEGLFEKAIMQSSSGLGWWTFDDDASERTHRFARRLGCPEETIKNPQALKEYLREQDGDRLLETALSLNHVYNMNFFMPVIERGGQDRILTGDPIELTRRGKIASRVPLIIGYNKDECGPVGEVMMPRVLKTIEEEGEKAMLRKLIRMDFLKATDADGERVRRRFHGSESFGPDSRSTIGKLMDYDRIKYHTWKAAQLFSANCANKEVYFYKYVHKATYGMWIVWGVEDQGYGPSHNDDVFAMFENKMLPIPVDAVSDKLASRNFWKLWSAFMRTGRPHKNWKPLSAEDSYMSIGPTLEVKKGVDESGNLAFWDDFARNRYPQQSKSKL